MEYARITPAVVVKQNSSWLLRPEPGGMESISCETEPPPRKLPMKLYIEFDSDQICEVLESDKSCGVSAYAMSDCAVWRRGARGEDGCARLFM